MLNRKCRASSQVEHRLPVVAGHLLPLRPLPVLLGDGDQDHAHHEHHQPDGQQARSQDVGDLLAVAGEVQAADDDAARQEAAPGGHEVDGEPVDLAPLFRDLGGPDGLAAGQAEHGALRAAGWRQLVPGLGEGALPQGDVLWAARHGLLGDSVGGGISLWGGRRDFFFFIHNMIYNVWYTSQNMQMTVIGKPLSSTSQAQFIIRPPPASRHADGKSDEENISGASLQNSLAALHIPTLKHKMAARAT